MPNVNYIVPLNLLAKLKGLAQYRCWTELEDGEYNSKFDPKEFSEGHYDLCYYGGYNDGLTKLAREILEEIIIEGNNE